MQWKQELALLACVATNWPFESFEDPQVQEFLHALDPNFIIPAWQMLSDELLNHEYTRTHTTIVTHQHGQYVTAQSDGWKDISKNHLIRFLVKAGDEVSHDQPCFVPDGTCTQF